VKETGDVINVSADFPEEFAESKYTKKLRGNLSKAKANASQVIGKLIVIAKNKILMIRFLVNNLLLHLKVKCHCLWFAFALK
jgi:hypothetical protein